MTKYWIKCGKPVTKKLNSVKEEINYKKVKQCKRRNQFLFCMLQNCSSTPRL